MCQLTCISSRFCAICHRWGHDRGRNPILHERGCSIYSHHSGVHLVRAGNRTIRFVQVGVPPAYEEQICCVSRDLAQIICQHVRRRGKLLGPCGWLGDLAMLYAVRILDTKLLLMLCPYTIDFIPRLDALDL